MKTIAKQLNVKKFPLEISYNDGQSSYLERGDGSWEITERDDEGRIVRFETSQDIAVSYEYKGKEVTVSAHRT